MSNLPLPTPEQAQELLDAVNLKLENWAVQANPWLRLQLLERRDFYTAVVDGTYTPETWPTQPLFH